MMIRIHGFLMGAAAMMLLLSPIPSAAQKSGATALVEGQSNLANAPGTSGCPDPLKEFYPCALAKANTLRISAPKK